MALKILSSIPTFHDHRIMCVHQAGLAIVGAGLPGKVQIRRLRLLPSADHDQMDALEIPTEFHQKILTTRDMQGQICIFLAGRIAELIILGDISNLGGEALKEANTIARHLIFGGGFSRMFPHQVFVDFVDKDTIFNFGEKIEDALDSEVQEILTHCAEITRTFLERNKDVLEELALSLEVYHQVGERKLRRILKNIDGAMDIPPLIK